jgi:hypothetical protein
LLVPDKLLRDALQQVLAFREALCVAGDGGLLGGLFGACHRPYESLP